MQLFRSIVLYFCIFPPASIAGFITPPPPPPPPPQQKFLEFAKLARIRQNFVPVTILNILNGVVTNSVHPISGWIFSPQFLAASTMVHLFTAGSMVLNDIYDIEVDKINNPARPLVAGTIQPREAAIFAAGLFSLYSYLGVAWIPAAVSPIWKSSLVVVLLYTPILKRIPLVKNLACSSIVAATVPFIGLSIAPISYDSFLMGWPGLTMRTAFATSIFIEIMLDILDREGDAKTGIQTLPVLLGPQMASWGLTMFLLANYVQSIWICVDMSTGALRPAMFGAVLAAYLPLFMNIYSVQRTRFSKQAIRDVIKLTTGSMVAFFTMYLISSSHSLSVLL